MTAVKICGLNDAAGVAAALEGGADYLGFVLFPRSPRAVSAARAAELAAPAQGRAQVVALMVDPGDAAAAEAAQALRPDLIQLHGAETPARAAAVAAATGVPVMKALPVASAADVAAADAFRAAGVRLLFDARPPAGADRPGGHGAAFDWALMRGQPADGWLLAGGLTPANVAAAIAASGAAGVDVSSGVERAPGLKDPALIAAFLKAARAP